ncbi:sugar phosphate nucleotidyltransferase [Candidatus Bipolaricaulota bacterium]
MKTIILAGGYATRFYPITAWRAKPLLPVAGKPIINYLLDSYPFSDRPIVTTNRRFAEQFATWKNQSGHDVEIVVEETRAEEEKLGTVGSISYLIQMLGLDEDLLIIGADNIFEFSFRSFLDAYQGHPLIALSDIGDIERVRGRYGVAVVEDGRIVEFQEKPQDPRSSLASTACYIYPKEVLPYFREFVEGATAGRDAPGYFNAWLLKTKSIRMDAFIFNTGWYDIGDRASYIEATQRYASTDTWQGEDVVIENSVVKDSVLFDGVKIINSSIAGCVIDRRAHLDGVTLSDCLIGEGTVIKRA